MNIKSPSVSVLIPVFNRERYIGNCIESVLSQSFCDFEVVIVDNASTDRTWDIVQHYAKCDNRIRSFQNTENLGPVQNWQRCLQEARGRFGKFLFSDDLIYPDNLKITAPYFNNPEIGLVFTAVHTGSAIGLGMPVLYEWKDEPSIVPSKRLIEGILFDEQLPFSPGAALFRISDLRRYILNELPSPTVSGFSKTGAGVDLLCYLLTAKDYALVGHVCEPLGFFRSHAESISVMENEIIASQYTQARIIFAQCYMSKEILVKILILSWLADCRRAKRLVSYQKTIRRYVTQPPRASLGEIIKVGWMKKKTLQKKLGHVLAMRL